MYNLDLESYNRALRALLDIEEKQLKLQKVSGYTIDELTELFLCGAVDINKDRIPVSLSTLKGD